MQQPAGRLRNRLQHHDAGQDRERRKMVGQVFFCQADVFHRDDPLVRTSRSILSIRLNFTALPKANEKGSLKTNRRFVLK